MQELCPVENKVITLPKVKPNKKKPAKQTFVSDAQEYQVPFFQNLLTQLSEFCHGQHSVALLLGPKGSGKSKILDLFKTANPNCHFFHHSQGRLTGVDTLALDEQLDCSAVLASIAEQFEASDEQIVVLVDNADLLSLEEFKSIMSYFASCNNPAFKIILAGEDSLSRRLIKLFEKDFTRIPYMAIPISPLTFAEMKGYLRQIYGHSQKEKKILSNKHLERIFQLSMGYPGRVNRVAKQLLSELTGKSTKPVLKRKQKIWYVDLFLIISILVLLFSVALQIFQQANVLRTNSTPTVLKSSVLIKHQIMLPPPSNDAVPIDQLATPSYIASIEDSPEEHLVTQGLVLNLPEPPKYKN